MNLLVLFHLYSNIAPDPVMKLVQEMYLEMFHREITTIPSPTFFLFPLLQPSPGSLPLQAEGSALNPNSFAWEPLLHFLHRQDCVSSNSPSLGVLKALKAARL